VFYKLKLLKAVSSKNPLRTGGKFTPTFSQVVNFPVSFKKMVRCPGDYKENFFFYKNKNKQGLFWMDNLGTSGRLI